MYRTMTLTKKEEYDLRTAERKISKIILGPGKNTYNEYIIRINHKLRGEDIVKKTDKVVRTCLGGKNDNWKKK